VISIDKHALEEASERPVPQMTVGVVGGTAKTKNYVRIAGNRLLVEVTLQPSGEQIVATVDTGGGENTFYMPIGYGDRVLVDWVGDGGQAVILAKLNDGDGAFPTFGVQPAEEGRVPMFTALKTGSGQLVLVESGDDGDILMHSGGSVQLRADSGYQLLLSGRTHLGEGAQFTDEPTGACVGDAGTTTSGKAGTPYEPVAAAPKGGPIPPVVPPGSTVPVPVPADGIVRVKDAILSASGVDPAYWNWLLGFVGVLLSWTPVPGDGGAALKTAMTTYIGTNPVPTSLASEHRAGSLNTASDA